MRMWMVNPKFLCRKHLLGEHGEIHKHRHNFVKKHNIIGRLKPVVQIVPSLMKYRHDELASEMLRRGYNHHSPYEQPDVSYLGDLLSLNVDLEFNINDLSSRCTDCKRLLEEKE